MREIDEKIEIDGSDSKFPDSVIHKIQSKVQYTFSVLEIWWDFRPLFKNRADRYRMYMVILIGASSPFCIDDKDD